MNPQPYESPLAMETPIEIELERYEFFEEPRYRFDLDRRDFLKVLGGGIAVFLVLPEAGAFQQRGGRGGRGNVGGNAPQEIGAWLHIDGAGVVTAYSGKAEVGQNVRTSLTQAVAEELHIAPSSVRIVLADTDLCPFDQGTFGSRSTPDMVPRLRRAAAAARRMLIELAAGQLNVNKELLSVDDGRVIHGPSGQVLSFGELTKGQKLTKAVAADAPLTPSAEWKVSGTSLPKVNARDIVTGRHKFAPDMTLPGMLFGKILRPPTLKSTLVSADVERARAMPDVVVVHDAEAKFVGVAAPTEHLAAQALAAIRAEWKTPAQSSDSTLFADLKKSDGAGGGARGGGGGRGGEDRGSVEQGLAAATQKLAATYTIAYIAHAPLEPRAALAEWKEDKLTVWTGTQGPFRVRGNVAQSFGIPEERVRVIVPDTGSGYGGKHTVEAAVEAARLAKSAGKPVKVVWTREEEFTWAYFRPAGVIDVNAGVTNDGLISAWEFHNYNSGGSALRPLYDIPHQRCATHASNSPLRQGSYRALAATANHFARESHIDDLAHAAGKEPLEFRLANLKDARLRGVLEAAAKQFGWGREKPAAGRGFGIAGGSEKGSYVATCAEIAIDRPTGKVQIVRVVTAFECGKVLNPDHLKNQVEGAVVMGLGGALFEAIKFEEGQIMNAGFAQYRVPRFSDVPQLETVLVDRPDLPSVGAGETPIVAVAPAIGNAIFQATGIRIRSLPMVPEGLKS
jgi:isoquinoline 1-oxidoreductase